MRINSSAAVASLSRPSEPQSVSDAAAPTVTGIAGPLSPFPGIPTKPSADTNVRLKQADQLDSMVEGVATGSLTRQETETLLKEQQAISDFQRDAMSDGRMDLFERVNLLVMQARAGQNIEEAKNNSSRDSFSMQDPGALMQSGQIAVIAEGRRTGNITNSESVKLLGQQADIASTRGPFTNWDRPDLLTQIKQNQAAHDIHLHSKPGTQFDFGDFLPPRPKPFLF